MGLLIEEFIHQGYPDKLVAAMEEAIRNAGPQQVDLFSCAPV